jgi:hypothetical protein
MKCSTPESPLPLTHAHHLTHTVSVTELRAAHPGARPLARCPGCSIARGRPMYRCWHRSSATGVVLPAAGKERTL